jgi:hypothetical protein
MNIMDKKTILIIAIIILAITFVGSAIIFFLYGWSAVWRIFKTLLTIILIILFIALIVYLVWYFFIKKRKFDVTAVNKKKLILAGKTQCPSIIHNCWLRLSGDKGHSWVNFGKIKGYCRIQILTRESVLDEDNNPKYDVDEYNRKSPQFQLDTEEQDVFIVQRGIFPMTLFIESDVVRVHPNDHDELIGDVTLFGLNILPISEYWYLASDYLDVRKLDRAILLEAHRGILFESMKDYKTVVDMAINLDQRHRKNIEEKSLMEIPQLQQLQQGGK